MFGERILFLLLLKTAAWLCLKHSRNLGTTFKPRPVYISQCACSHAERGANSCHDASVSGADNAEKG